jgi:hypothetical protein
VVVKKYNLIGLFAIMALLGCGLTDTLIANTVGGAKGNTVSSLWNDVPPLQGSQKLALDLPITMQVAIQGLIKASASNSNVQLDQFDWIAYSTSMTPQQVAAYYSNERMATAGWNLKDMPGCTAGSGDANVAGGFCVFGKGLANTGNKGSMLFIVLGQDDKTKQTQVYYVRLEGLVGRATPSK